MKRAAASRLAKRLAIVAAIAILIALAWWRFARPERVPVILHGVDRGRVEATIANTRAGTVEACRRTRLATITGGRIEVLAVKEGDRVSKGQLLMKLWNDDQEAQLALARSQVVSATKRVAEACTLAANASREAERQTALRQRGFVSLAAEEKAVAEARARNASCEAARADVVQSEMRVKATRAEQGRTVLYAPFSGTVAKIVGEVGEYSTPSPPGIPMPPAIDLIDDSCLYVEAPMDEVDAPKLRIGQTARITLDALPGQAFPGEVRRVAPYVEAVEKQSRTVNVEATFNRPEAVGSLLVGYSADIEVILDARDNVVRVPTSALLEGNRVLVPDARGRLEARTIKPGLANWEYTEVIEGLAPGERVVTSLEREGVKAGAPITEEEPQ